MSVIIACPEGEEIHAPGSLPPSTGILVVAPQGGRVRGELPPGTVRLEIPPGSSRAEAWNRGIEAAGGGTVVLLHPRALLAEGALERLADLLAAAPGLGAAAPREWLDPGHTFLHHPLPPFARAGEARARTGPLAAARARRRDAATLHLLEAQAPVEMEAARGSVLAVRGEALAGVGPFDPDLPEGFDLLEWCRRLRRAGYRIVLVPDASAVVPGTLPAARDWPRIARAHNEGIPLLEAATRTMAARLVVPGRRPLPDPRDDPARAAFARAPEIVLPGGGGGGSRPSPPPPTSRVGPPSRRAAPPGDRRRPLVPRERGGVPHPGEALARERCVGRPRPRALLRPSPRHGSPGDAGPLAGARRAPPRRPPRHDRGPGDPPPAPGRRGRDPLPVEEGLPEGALARALALALPGEPGREPCDARPSPRRRPCHGPVRRLPRAGPGPGGDPRVRPDDRLHVGSGIPAGTGEAGGLHEDGPRLRAGLGEAGRGVLRLRASQPGRLPDREENPGVHRPLPPALACPGAPLRPPRRSGPRAGAGGRGPGGGPDRSAGRRAVGGGVRLPPDPVGPRPQVSRVALRAPPRHALPPPVRRARGAPGGHGGRGGAVPRGADLRGGGLDAPPGRGAGGRALPHRGLRAYGARGGGGHERILASFLPLGCPADRLFEEAGYTLETSRWTWVGRIYDPGPLDWHLIRTGFFLALGDSDLV